jgi:hypothetical protein
MSSDLSFSLVLGINARREGDYLRFSRCAHKGAIRSPPGVTPGIRSSVVFAVSFVAPRAVR